MQLFDPARPKINNLPAFLIQGQPRGVCPAITIHFLPDGYELAVFLPSSDKGWSRKTCKCDDSSEIGDILRAWLFDPERAAVLHFNWTEPSYTPPSKAKSEITLEMLGL
jgi:hypothetical protein